MQEDSCKTIQMMKNLDYRIKSQSGKSELQETVVIITGKLRKLEKLERKKAAFEEKNTQLEKELAGLKVLLEDTIQQRDAEIENALRVMQENEKLIKTLKTTLNEEIEGQNQVIHITAKCRDTVRINRDMAISSSPMIKEILESEMKESKSGVISLDQYNINAIRVLVAYMRVGESHTDLVEVPELSADEFYNLLELTSYMRVPWAFQHLANQMERFVHSLDVPFLINVSSQVDTGHEGCPWAKLFVISQESIAAKIEQHSSGCTFSQLNFHDLHNIIKLVKDEELSVDFSENQSAESSNCFFLHTRASEGKVVAFVQISRNHQSAFKSNSNKVGLFRFVLSATKSGRIDKTWSGTSRQVCPRWGFSGLFHNERIQRLYCPGPGLKGLKLSFKAGMVCLHRQAFALTSYACAKLGEDVASALEIHHVLSALAYFDQHSEDESARSLLMLLQEYAALSFDLTKDSAAWHRLPTPLVSGVLARHCLSARKEAEVLRFVVGYAMARPDHPPGSSSPADGAGAADVFCSLVQHVRFPFISQQELDEVLTAEQRAFVARQPCYTPLIVEAAEVQQGKRPAPAAPGSEERAAKRARYGAVPALDLKYLLERAYAGRAGPGPA